MKDKIISGLARLGWQKDRIVDAFCKEFETAVVPVCASIWLRRGMDSPCWVLTDGNFTSAGENVLAATFAEFPDDMPDGDVEQSVAAFVGKMEARIAGAWSVRLLRSGGQKAPLSPAESGR